MPSERIFYISIPKALGRFPVRRFPTDKVIKNATVFREAGNTWMVLPPITRSSTNFRYYCSILNNVNTRLGGSHIDGNTGRGLRVLYGFAKMGVLPDAAIEKIKQADDDRKARVRGRRSAEAE